MKSRFRGAVEQLFAQGKLSRIDFLGVEPKSAEEAEDLCLLIRETLHRPKYAARLLRAFQPEDPSEEVVEVLRTQGTAALLELEPRLEGSAEGTGDDRLLLLKLLAMYGTAEGTERIIAVARSGHAVDHYLWGTIFGLFTDEHPEAERLFSGFKGSLPGGFAAVALLDAANHYAIYGGELQHPFDSDQGRALLRGWLRALDPEQFSYAHSATAALPFISEPPRNELLQLAMDHPDTGVSVEAAWAAAKIGMERGIRELARYSKEINTAAAATRLLTELGREDAIPPEAQDPDFRAMAEMVSWLAHPNEFGEAPDRISLYDTRELYWPPTNDYRQVWLFRYEYNKSEHREEAIGLGMVGSVTFALFGETTAELPALHAYALHCCFELAGTEDPRAPKKRGITAGLAILAEYNDLPEHETSEPVEEAAETEAPKEGPAALLAEMVDRAKETRASEGVSDRSALQSALKEMHEARLQALKKEVEEVRAHLAAQRRSAPAVRTATHPGSVEVLERPEVKRQRVALEAAGYRLEGVFEFENIPGFDLVLFTHPEDGTIATISCGQSLTTELAAEYADGRGFYVRDSAAVPGLTPAPWAEYRYEPGATVPELLEIFQATRPPNHERKSGAAAAAELAPDFRRVQLWRLERGGWNREEVQVQMGITDPEADEERLNDACLSIREKWLYAWFKDKNPETAESLLEDLIIVHDEHTGPLLFFLWAMGGGSAEVRVREFEGLPGREAFHRVNETNGRPLTLIARKEDGFGADFYRPSLRV